MAIRTTAGTALALALNGAGAVPLRSAQPPARRVERTLGARNDARFAVGELTLEADLADAAALLGWLHAAQDGAARSADADLLVADGNRKLQRRLALRGLLLTGAAITPLSASAGRSAVALTLRCQPETVSDLPDSGPAPAAPGGRRKLLLASNFRVGGLPFDAGGVQALTLPALNAEVQRAGARRPSAYTGAPTLGPLGLTLTGRSLAPARAWLAKVLAGDGTAARGQDFSVELLDSTLRKPLATVQLGGCALATVDEPALDAAGTAPATLNLGWTVARMTIALAS